MSHVDYWRGSPGPFELIEYSPPGRSEFRPVAVKASDGSWVYNIPNRTSQGPSDLSKTHADAALQLPDMVNLIGALSDIDFSEPGIALKLIDLKNRSKEIIRNIHHTGAR